LRSVVLRSVSGRSCSIRYGEKQARIELKPGEVAHLTANLERRKS